MLATKPMNKRQDINKYRYTVSRIVVLPDYQGLGIGKVLLTYIASCYRAVYPKIKVTITSSLIFWWKALNKNDKWRFRNNSNSCSRNGNIKTLNHGIKFTKTFEYIGEKNDLTESKKMLGLD